VLVATVVAASRIDVLFILVHHSFGAFVSRPQKDRMNHLKDILGKTLRFNIFNWATNNNSNKTTTTDNSNNKQQEHSTTQHTTTQQHTTHNHQPPAMATATAHSSPHPHTT
jgi:hypothetical protein